MKGHIRPPLWPTDSGQYNHFMRNSLFVYVIFLFPIFELTVGKTQFVLSWPVNAMQLR